MAIVNRRNAVIGYVVLKAGRRAAVGKTHASRTRRAVVAAIATTGGVIVLVTRRRRRSPDVRSPDME
jgi:hypothetical protein